MKRTLIFVLSAIFCMALFAGCTQTPAEPEHEHTLVHNEAVAPSCEKSGMMEYWCCSECDACFSDAEGTTEVAIADLEVKALGHTAGDDDGDCTTAVDCTVCGKTAVAAKSHVAGQDDVDCTTAVKCANCEKNAIEANASHTPDEDDGDCTTAVKCANCEQIVTAGADAHTPGEDDGDCTTAVECANCEKNAIEANASHTPAEDDGNCTTAVKCVYCEKNAIDGAAAHDFGINNEKCAICTVENPHYIPEMSIPANSVLITDFSAPVNPYIGHMMGNDAAHAYYNSYVVLDNRAGVFAMGSNCYSWMWYTGVGLDSMDLTGMETITFRMKISSNLVSLDLKVDGANSIPIINKFDVRGEWTELTFDIADLGFADITKANITFVFGTPDGGECEYVWLDQVYASPEDPNAPKELPIPDGATLITNFGKTVSPFIGHMMGNDAAHAYYNTYKALDGRAGVFAMGSNCYSWMWYTGTGLDNMDLRGMGTITFRMKVNSKIVSLDLKIDGTHSISILDKIPVKDEWTEITFSVAELGFADVSKAGITFVFGTPDGGSCEYVWLDQVYATPKDSSIPDELAIPEGATLISNYGKIVTPYIGHMMGNDAAHAYYNTYDVYDGRAGVFAMGSNCEAWMWYTGAGLDNMNLTGKTTITFRIKVSSSIKSLDLRIDGDTETGHSYAVKDLITVKDEWTELTVNIADLNFADITKANLTFRFGTPNGGECEYVWLDQVYVQ